MSPTTTEPLRQCAIERCGSGHLHVFQTIGPYCVFRGTVAAVNGPATFEVCNENAAAALGTRVTDCRDGREYTIGAAGGALQIDLAANDDFTTTVTHEADGVLPEVRELAEVAP